jgi:hypothetical protein
MRWRRRPRQEVSVPAKEPVRFLPPPRPNGAVHYESLGRFIDNLMGDARIRRRAREKLEPILLRPEEMPPDPPPPLPPYTVYAEPSIEREGRAR